MSEETTSAVPARLDGLKPKMKLEGTVKKVELFGAFVDVGVGRDGLVHISALRRGGRVTRVEEVVKEGDQVTVWVRSVDTAKGRLELTMIEPLALEWHEIKKGTVLKGKVTRLERFGAFVEVGAERPGLIHVSELTHGFVGDPSDLLKVGEEVEAVVVGVDPRKKQLNLSLKALESSDQGEEAEEEHTLTAMELALRSAMEGADQQSTASAGQTRRQRETARRQQEDLLARTLRTQPKDARRG